jgi:hypothetical protein
LASPAGEEMNKLKIAYAELREAHERLQGINSKNLDRIQKLENTIKRLRKQNREMKADLEYYY